METKTTSNHLHRSQVLKNQSIQNHLKTKEISYLENCLTLAKREQTAIINQSLRLYEYHLVTDDLQRIIAKAYPEAYKKLSSTGLLNQLYQKDYAHVDAFKKDVTELLYRIFFSEGKDTCYDYNDLAFCNQKQLDKLAQQGIFIHDAWVSQLLDALSSKSIAKNILLQQLTPEWLWSRTLRFFIYLSELTRETFIKKARTLHSKMEVHRTPTSFDRLINKTSPLIKPYTKKELTQLYGISSKVLRTWLKMHDELLGKNTKLFNVKQVDFIFQQYGFPKCVLLQIQ